MLKKCKKILIVLLITILIIGLTTNVQAKLSQTFEVLNTKEVKSLQNEQGTITKEILQINKEQKQIDMQIKLENTFDKDTEIIFVIDNSTSMGTIVSNNENRKQKVVSTTKDLVSQLFKGVLDSKIAVVQFSDNASVINTSTDKEDTLINSLNSFMNNIPAGQTNIVSGIQKATSMYAEDAKQKVMIILTDGAPTNSLQDVSNILKNVEKSGISIFTGIIDIEQASNLAEGFGTVDKPVAGRLYDIKSTSISEIAKEIQGTIQKETSGSIYNVKIEDYFPKEIVENFTIKIGTPTKGNVTDGIGTDRKITWEMDELARGESATLQFSLIGKEEESINKNLKTNENFVLTYKDGANKEYKEQLNSQPEVKVVTEGKKDVTKLPQTGEGFSFVFIIIGLILIRLAILYREYRNACKK